MPIVPADPSLVVPPELLDAWERHPEIVKYGDPVLRKPARPIVRFNVETSRLIKRMIGIMRDASGLGLAAPQIGESTRIIVYDANEGDGLRVLVNPTILSRWGEQIEPKEGCLSIPGLQGVVKRANELRIRGFDEKNRPVAKRVKGLEARVIQHEIDHLDGVLFIDRVEAGTLEWAFGNDDDDESDEQAPQE